MTGICMAVAFDGSAVSPEVVEAMTAAAAHRGPDGSRTWSGTGAGAGHLRLELTREDRSEVQPLVRGPLVCVADARIDNRADLLRALQGTAAAGGAAGTDSELLLSAYQAWGPDCASHVVGDFAFAVWDTRSRTLFAARDPVGARTLFYRSEPGRRALLGSEVAQILAAPGVPDRPDEQSVLADVAGLYALPDASHHEGIRQLAPGHALLIGGREERSWSFREIGRGPRIRYRREQEYAEHFREVLDEAVRARLCTDRPAGLLLSGGLDSSSVAALGARHRDGDGTPSLTGFSWAFDELSDADERHVSDPLAAELGLPVHEVPADDAWPLSGWPQRGPFRDDPYTWLYQELFQRSADRARQAGVRVLLTADRGDEVTGGWVYDELGLLATGRLRSLATDRHAYRERTGRSNRSFLQERLLQPLATAAWPPERAWPLRRQLRGLLGGDPKPFAPWVPQAAAERLGLRDVMASALPVPPVRGHARRQRVMAVSDVIGLRVLQLRQRTFAHAGLQHADPWADERVLSFVCAVPQQVVQRQSSPKHLTREAMRGVLPDAARTSPAPSNQYPLYQRAFVEREVATVRELMRDSRADAAGLLDAGAVLATYESLLRGEPVYHDFWYPLTVELWLRRWWG